LLDLDGTVLDSHGLIMSSWRYMCEQHLKGPSGEMPTDDDFRRGMGRPLLEVLRTFARDDAHAQELVTCYRAHNAQHHDAMIRPFPGIPEALATLRAAGVKLAIVTSKSKEFALRGLAVTGLEVDLVISPSDVTHAKPSPEPVLLALRRLEAEPAQAVMVGDSPHDLLAGRAASVLTAAVSWGAFSLEELLPYAPDRVLRHPSELVALALDP
jgi:pyrophosphatase PpaX